MGGPLRGRHLLFLHHQALSGAQAALYGLAAGPSVDRCGQDVNAPSVTAHSTASSNASSAVGPTIMPTVCPRCVTVGPTIVHTVCPH